MTFIKYFKKSNYSISQKNFNIVFKPLHKFIKKEQNTSHIDLAQEHMQWHWQSNLGVILGRGQLQHFFRRLQRRVVPHGPSGT